MEIDFLSGLINLGIMVGIVGIIEGLKTADKKSDEHGAFYVILFFVVCLVSSIAMSMKDGNFISHWTIGVGDAVEKLITYFGLGTIFYKYIVKWIKAKIQNLEADLVNKNEKWGS